MTEFSHRREARRLLRRGHDEVPASFRSLIPSARLTPAVVHEVAMWRIGLAVVLAPAVALAPSVAKPPQATRVPRIGYLVLSPLVDPPSDERWAFLSGLRELGYVIGQNVAIEYRSGAWNRELPPELAAELVEEPCSTHAVDMTPPMPSTGLVSVATSTPRIGTRSGNSRRPWCIRFTPLDQYAWNQLLCRLR